MSGADEAMAGAELLLDAGNRAGAANRLYYAAFHAARAALATKGRYAKTHTGLISSFAQTFGEVPVLKKLFGIRAVADYGPAERFVETIDDLLRYRDDAKAFIDRCRAIVDEAGSRGPDESDPPPDL